jgi:Fe-S cluster assembly iron-binding protein IscA
VILDNQKPLIRLDQPAVEVLRQFMQDKDNHRVIRINLSFKGCCDPALELCLDSRTEQDLICSQDGITLVMSPETYETAGSVSVSYMAETGRTGFAISSRKPISEWDGFGVCQIRS